MFIEAISVIIIFYTYLRFMYIYTYINSTYIIHIYICNKYTLSSNTINIVYNKQDS